MKHFIKSANTAGLSWLIWIALVTAVLVLVPLMSPNAFASMPWLQGEVAFAQTTITVDGTTCTLADAITAANTDTATGGCVAGSGADIIDLQTDVTLTSALPGTGGQLTINGNDHIIARASAAPNFRILRNGGNLTLNQVTITGGRESQGEGGGIQNVATLTINDSVIRDNYARDGGAGISNQGTLTLNNSTISSNSTSPVDAGYGSALHNRGTATINNSTISNHTAPYIGNFSTVSNSGTFDRSAVMTINNSTISSNTRGGISNFDFTDLTIDSSTIANNSRRPALQGGFQTQTTVRNSIIVGDAGQSACEYTNITSQGYNLSNDATCGFTNTGDQQNVSTAALNLGPLADNGGSTQTHALLPGSLAIDTGDTTLTTDQRGEPRPYGTADDIGAFEVQGAAIIIRKQTVPTGGLNFGFVITDTLGVASSFALSDTEQLTFDDLPSGSYTVTELPFSTGFLSGLRCDDSSSAMPSTVDIAARTANIQLEPGETVTCTFINSEDDLIVITKVTEPAGGTGFTFSSDIPGSTSFSLDDLEFNTAQVTPGTYTITETNAGPDYDLTAINCAILGPGPNDYTRVNGDLNTGSVDVTLTAAGQSVLCAFTNTKRGSITVVKEANPTDGTDFAFELRGDATASFQLDHALPDDNDGISASQTFTLPVGNYSVAEINVPSGWENTSFDCVRGNSLVGFNLSDLEAFIQLAPGDDVTCTYLNGQPGTITIVKDATPADDTVFNFTIADANGAGNSVDFDLQDPSNASRTFSPAFAGSFVVTETLQAGWTLSNISCDSSSGGSTFATDTGQGLLGITLAPTDNVTCTFVNNEYGTITVVKEANPTDGTDFAFELRGDATASFQLDHALPDDNDGISASQTFTLPVGNYSVAEINVPSGWENTSFDCVRGNSLVGLNLSDLEAFIQLAPGDDVTCTYLNGQPGTITIVKDATPADDTVFNFTIADANDASDSVDFDLQDPSNASRTFSPAFAGSFVVTETLQAGWTLSNISCDSSSGGSTFTTDTGQGLLGITLAPTDNITCTFTNIKNPTPIPTPTVTNTPTPSATPTTTPTATATPTPARPVLSVPTGVSGTLGAPVTVPVMLNTNGDAIASLIFSIDFDQQCLIFDPTDADNNNIPDAITFNVPAVFTRAASFDGGDSDGEIDFSLSNVINGVPLADGTIVNITFSVKNDPACAGIDAAVNFSTDPSASFGTAGGGSIPGDTQNGTVSITGPTPLFGDCNNDGNVDAGDISAVILEIFDGDGNLRDNAPGGTFPGTFFCDANSDGFINAADISCTTLIIFNGQGACGAPLLRGAADAAFAELAVQSQAVAAGAAVAVPITLQPGEHRVTAATFAVTFDPAALTLDLTDGDRDGIPDAVDLTVGAGQVAVVNADADRGRMEIALFASTTDAPLLATGTLVTLTFTTKTDRPGEYVVALVEGSLGNEWGQSLEAKLVDGALQIITETMAEEIYLPLIRN